MVQIRWSKLAPGCTFAPCANCAHERNLFSHMYNLILDFDKLPIFSIRPCMKLSYINRPLIKLNIMASVATASSDMPGCQAEQLEFLVHWLRFARFYFRAMSLLHLSTSLGHPMFTSVKRYPLHDNGVPPFTIRVINAMFRRSNN